MSTQSPYKSNVSIRSDTTSLSADHTTDAVNNLGPFNSANVRLEIIAAAVSSGELRFYLQTSYNGGTDWADVECFTLTVGLGQSATKNMVITNPVPVAATSALVETDGSLANNTKNDLPLGDSLRIKVDETGTSTYEFIATAIFRI